MYHRNKETAKKMQNLGKWPNLGQKIKKFEFISHMGMLYTILKEILYRFLFLSLKIEDMSLLEGIAYGKILDLP